MTDVSNRSRQASPTVLLLLLCIAVFLATLSTLMLGPLLVDLAIDLHTSVALVGQLGGVTALAWVITAPVASPLSDIYGRRLLLLIGLTLMGLGILGSGIAWNYSSLVALRLLTGIGAAMIPPNCLAAVADVFPAERRGKAIGWLVSSTGVSAALGIAIVALLLGYGGWRLPFYAVGVMSLVLLLFLWVWFPKSQVQPGRPLAFISHYREVGSSAMIWYVLAANSLLQMVFFGAFAYLAAKLILTYGMTAGETVLPLTLAGLGVIAGGFIGGRIASQRRRLALLVIISLVAGLLAALVFTTTLSPWTTVALAFGVGSMTRISTAVTPTLLMELAGSSRATATGMFGVSNHVGSFGGASIGGAMLALGGFPLVGLFFLGVAVSAALVVLVKVRDSAAFLDQFATPALKADSD